MIYPRRLLKRHVRFIAMIAVALASLFLNDHAARAEDPFPTVLSRHSRLQDAMAAMIALPVNGPEHGVALTERGYVLFKGNHRSVNWTGYTTSTAVAHSHPAPWSYGLAPGGSPIVPNDTSTLGLTPSTGDLHFDMTGRGGTKPSANHMVLMPTTVDPSTGIAYAAGERPDLPRIVAVFGSASKSRDPLMPGTKFDTLEAPMVYYAIDAKGSAKKISGPLQFRSSLVGGSDIYEVRPQPTPKKKPSGGGAAGVGTSGSKSSGAKSAATPSWWRKFGFGGNGSTPSGTRPGLGSFNVQSWWAKFKIPTLTIGGLGGRLAAQALLGDFAEVLGLLRTPGLMLQLGGWGSSVGAALPAIATALTTAVAVVGVIAALGAFAYEGYLFKSAIDDYDTISQRTQAMGGRGFDQAVQFTAHEENGIFNNPIIAPLDWGLWGWREVTDRVGSMLTPASQWPPDKVVF